MHRRASGLLLIFALMAGACAGDTTTDASASLADAVVAPTEPPEPTSTPEPEATPTPEPSPTPEATPTPEPSPTPEAEATAEPTVEATTTPEPTPEAATTPEPTPEATTTPEPASDPTTTPESPDDSQQKPDLPPSTYNGEVLAIRTASGAVVAVRGVTADTYEVVTPCYDLAQISAGLPIMGPIDIVIDPGHGGDESGAVGPNGLKESTVNLQVAEQVRNLLIERGFTVELTRYSDVRVAIQSRAELATALRPRVFMSIHHNGGYPDSFPVAGTEVFVQLDDPESARLGGLVFEEIQIAFSDVNIDWMGSVDSFGVAWRKNDEGTDLYGVLRRTPDLVSVLTEAMFISTAAEAELLTKPETIETEAIALANAVERWFETDDGGSGFVEGITFQGDLGNGGGTIGCVDPPLG